MDIQYKDERFCFDRKKSPSFVSERIEDMGKDVADLIDLVMGGKDILFYFYFISELKQCSGREGETACRVIDDRNKMVILESGRIY